MLKGLSASVKRFFDQSYSSYIQILIRLDMQNRVISSLTSYSKYKKVEIQGYPLMFYLFQKQNANLINRLTLSKIGLDILHDSNNPLGVPPLFFCLLNNIKLPERPDYNYFIQDQGGHSLVHYSCFEGNQNLMQFCESLKMNFNATDHEGNTPLHLAVQGNQQAAIDKLIMKNVKSTRNLHNWEPIHFAASSNNLPIFKKIQKLASNYRQLPPFIYPIHIAAQFGCLEIIKYLIDQNKDVNLNITNAQKFTPLHFAVLSDNREVVNYFLSNGALANSKDLYGNSPLHISVLQKKRNSLQCLLKCKRVDRQILNSDGLSIVQLAEADQHKDILEMIRKTWN